MSNFLSHASTTIQVANLRRKVVIFIALAVASIFIVSSILVYQLTSGPAENPPQIDTSWIPVVEQLLQDAKPYPPDNSSLSPAANPEVINVYLAENGSEQLIYYGDGSNLSNYLTALMESVNYQKVPRVSEVFIGEVMQNDTVVNLNYNITMVLANNPTQRFYAAYFVLQDNQNVGLTGAIFVRSTQPLKDGHLGMWMITK